MNKLIERKNVALTKKSLEVEWWMNKEREAQAKLEVTNELLL